MNRGCALAVCLQFHEENELENLLKNKISGFKEFKTKIYLV
jgi:hypothetical protein